ncbi:MAG: hypothetical protein R3D85_12610 [Paracoccaceae bacterium]
MARSQPTQPAPQPPKPAPAPKPQASVRQTPRPVITDYASL